MRHPLGDPRTVARHQPGRCARDRRGAGSGRPGYHVRLCLLRNQRVHARLADPRTGHPKRTGRHPARRQRDDLSASRLEKPGDDRVRRRQTAQTGPHDRRFDAARRIHPARRHPQRERGGTGHVRENPRRCPHDPNSAHESTFGTGRRLPQ